MEGRLTLFLECFIFLLIINCSQFQAWHPKLYLPKPHWLSIFPIYYPACKRYITFLFCQLLYHRPEHFEADGFTCFEFQQQ